MIHGKYSRLAQLLAMCAFVTALVLYPPKAHAGQTIKIMTLNIHGFKSKTGPDTDMNLLKDLIVDSGADIVAMQEVLYEDKAIALMNSVFGPSANDTDNFVYKEAYATELAVFSKYRVSLDEPAGSADVRALRVNLDISPLGISGVDTIPIINLHPQSEHLACSYTNASIAPIYPIFDNIQPNQIVLGDFNMVFRYPLDEGEPPDYDNRICVGNYFPRIDNTGATAKYFASCGGEEGYPGNLPNTTLNTCYDKKSTPGGSNTGLGPNKVAQILDYVIVDANSNFKLVSSNILNNDAIGGTAWDDTISDHYAVIATLEYLPNAQPPQPPAATSTPTPTVQQQAAGQNSGGGRGRAIGSDRNNDDYMYYCIFAICYFMLVHFGFSNGRKFRLGEIGLIIIFGLGAVYAFGLMGGVFVLFLGSFLLFM